MNQILGFLRLQQIDTRLDQVNSRLKQINSLLEDNKAIEHISEIRNAIKQRIDSSTHQLILSEQDVFAQHIKIQQVEARLYSGKVKNPKELMDLQAEISSLKRYYLSLENSQLHIMMSLENDQKEYEKASVEFNSVEKEFFSKNKLLIIERDAYLKEIERLDAEKKAAENSISNHDLSIYKELRKKKGGIAVSTTSDGACNSCGATLTPAQEQAAKSAEQTIRCPSCGRFLYVE